MLATANPKLRVLVFHDEKQPSSDLVQQLFACASCPANILPVCAPCFLQANPVSQIHHETKRDMAQNILWNFHHAMEHGACASAKDSLFDYISCFAPEEVFPEQSDCALNRGWVFRVYFDLDFMCGLDLLTNMHDIFHDRYRSWRYDYERAKCAIWGEPGEYGSNLSLVAGAALSDFQHRRNLQTLFDTPGKGLDIVDSCAFIYHQKALGWPLDSGELASAMDLLKSAISSHNLHQIKETITQMAQPFSAPAQEELIGYCVNTSNTEALSYLYTHHDIGDIDTLTRHLSATLNDHNTLMTQTLLQLGARLHSDVFEKALTKAVKKFQLATIEFLLDLTPEATIDPQLLNAALMEAIDYCYIPMADWLLTHGAKISSSPRKDYLFYTVINCNNSEVWDWLYDHGLQSTPQKLSQCLYCHILRESDNEPLDWLAAHGATAHEMPEEDAQIVQWNYQNDCLAPHLITWLKHRFPDFLTDDPVEEPARCQIKQEQQA